MALKAGLVNNPPRDAEGRFYAEIGRSKPAPQGICVVNSAGKVLNWALMFDDDQSVLAFLDHALKRFAMYPGAKLTVAAERFMKFPSAKLEDVADSGKILPVIEGHAPGTNCPAEPPRRSGTVMARVFGRALDSAGRPVADTLCQEHYVEDRFDVPVEMQEGLVTSIADSGMKRVRLADDFARLLVSHAYLGQLDVNPVDSPAGKGALRECEFWAQSAGTGDDDHALIRIDGRSNAAGPSREGERVGKQVDGRLWKHEVKLVWEGVIETRERRISRLLLTASGSETLMWKGTFRGLDESNVARLPAGHPIDLACAVRYGIIGEPLPADKTVSVEPAQLAATSDAVPEDARRRMIEVLGPPFLVFRDDVAKELKLSEEQTQTLERLLQSTIRETQQTFQKIVELPPQERERELHSHRQKAQANLTLLLKDTLTAMQQARMRQVELQQEGLFALRHMNIALELKITNDQRQQFMALLQKMQTEIGNLVNDPQSQANPNEIHPKVMKIRTQFAAEFEALLTAVQKQEWKKLLGDPLEPTE